MRKKEYWDRDDIQFSRLLAEIKAAGLTGEQLVAIRDSMSLTTTEVCELLDRAEETWDALKVDLDFVNEHCVVCSTKLVEKGGGRPFSPEKSMKKRIVVFSTSDIQTYVSGDSRLNPTTYVSGDSRLNPTPPKFQSTGELERALSLGFTVYVISTRHKLSETDKWWFDKADYVYLATSAMDSLCANSPALIAPWLKFFQELNISLPVKARPDDDTEWLQDQFEGPLPQRYGFNSWLEARDYLMYVKHPNDTIIVTGSDFRRLYP